MMVQWRWIGLLAALFAAFLLDGTLFYWLLPAEWTFRVVSRLVLIGVVFAALFLNRHVALALGLGFGFLHDLVYYGHMLGVHTFAMGLIGYGAGLFFQRKFITFFYLLTVQMLAFLAYETIVELVYRLFRVVRASFQWSLFHHTLPSLLFNMFLFMLVYIPVRHWLESGRKKDAEDDEANV